MGSHIHSGEHTQVYTYTGKGLSWLTWAKGSPTCFSLYVMSASMEAINSSLSAVCLFESFVVLSQSLMVKLGLKESGEWRPSLCTWISLVPCKMNEKCSWHLVNLQKYQSCTKKCSMTKVFLSHILLTGLHIQQLITPLTTFYSTPSCTDLKLRKRCYAWLPREVLSLMLVRWNLLYIKPVLMWL